MILIAYREARIEFGEKVASRLKLSRDGTKVLWPQPSDDPNDPQNVGCSMTPPDAFLNISCSGVIGASTSIFS